MASKLNSVQEFYKDKSIFITGGSGFMGKVLIEKLLYSCSELKEIIILMRPKRGKTAHQRVEEFAKLPMFKRIMEEKPEVMRKINPVWGDSTQYNLGLNVEHLAYVVQNSQIVFHLAASLKLEATLKPNVLMNLTATKYVLDLAKQMKNLIQMVHTSTAFCNVEQDILEERVYESHHRPIDLIRSAEWMTEEAMARVQKDILGVHPNTYTYTKRLAEILVRDEYNESKLPVCIVRPSIVTPSYAEPLPGWVDSLNGPPGVCMAVGKGALRCILLNPEANFEAIPVDLAINGMIMIAKDLGVNKQRSKDIPVYNVTSHEAKRLTYGKFFNIANSMKWECPFSISLWYPNATMTLNRFWYLLNIILFQWIPAYFVDFLLFVFRQKRFMVHVQNKIAVGMDVLKCFTMNNWDFKSDNYKNLIHKQSKEEYDMFFIDSKLIESDPYTRQSLVGGRIYCTRDPLSTIPKAKKIIRVQYVVDLVCKFLFFYWLIKKVLNYTGMMEPAMNAVHNLQMSVYHKG